MPLMRQARFSRARQRGLSLVELMVGIALGMFVVAAATLMVSTQLGDNRRLLLETQVQQDLRAAADIVTRDLRRAGALRLADGHSGLASATVAAVDNPYMALTPTGAAATTEVNYTYVRTATETGPYGYRLNAGAIESLQGTGGWQQLTDPRTLRITTFSVTPVAEPPVTLTCQRLCADGSQDCWPQLRIRRFDIVMSGVAVSDAAVVRSLSTSVRVRNDDLVFDPTGAGGPLCP